MGSESGARFSSLNACAAECRRGILVRPIQVRFKPVLEQRHDLVEEGRDAGSIDRDDRFEDVSRGAARTRLAPGGVASFLSKPSSNPNKPTLSHDHTHIRLGTSSKTSA